MWPPRTRKKHCRTTTGKFQCRENRLSIREPHQAPPSPLFRSHFYSRGAVASEACRALLTKCLIAPGGGLECKQHTAQVACT